MRGRPAEQRPNPIPGPGSYDVKDDFLRERLRNANFSASPVRDTSQSMSP